MKIRVATEKITNILRCVKNARNSDLSLTYRLLIAYGHDPQKLTAYEMLKLMHEKEFPHFESIARDRRKIQEQAEKDGDYELLGDNRLARLKEQGKVQIELGYKIKGR